MKKPITRQVATALLANMTDDDFPTIDPSQDITDEQYKQLVIDGREAYSKAVGRPSLTAPGTHSPQVTLRLPESVNAQLSEVALRTGKRRSQIVRDALDEYLAAV
ncbi:MAG: ribbon-helix-helix protein, CopG family [Propionibacteriaceae bacterium]|nr:ribbon-helix-helix protein, CopG family [Propionibacteriaceae bacterium]